MIHLLKIRCFLSTGFFYQCDLVTEKCFVLRHDKATIKKEVANMKIKLNPDQEIVNTIREVTGKEERIEMEIRKWKKAAL